MRRNLSVCAVVCSTLLGSLAQAGCPAGQEAFTSCQIVNERSKLTRFQRLILTRLLGGKAPRRAALI